LNADREKGGGKNLIDDATGEKLSEPGGREKRVANLRPILRLREGGREEEYFLEFSFETEINVQVPKAWWASPSHHIGLKRKGEKSLTLKELGGNFLFSYADSAWEKKW